jgi:hypothetical protein
MRKTLVILSAFCVALTYAATSLSDASAREFKRSGSYTTKKGRTGTYKSEGTRGDGTATRNQSITTQDGKTFDRSVTRTYDKDTGTFTRSVTNPRGDTRTATGAVGEDGTRTGTVTTSGGKTAEFSGETVRNDDGSVTRNTSVTTADGQTLNRSATTSYDKDTGTISRSVTGPGGNTRTGEVAVQPDSSQ